MTYPKEYPNCPAGDFSATFHWRTPNKALNSVKVSNAYNLAEAQKLVMQHLHETMEVYVLPVLALIQGGKNA
jgi:hypothetical protein